MSSWTDHKLPNGTSIRKHTTRCVAISAIYDYIGFTDDEVEYIADYGFDCVTFGDAPYTLIGNNFALSCIVDGYTAYLDAMNNNVGEPSRNLPEQVLTREEITQKFWEIVEREDYVNLEV